MTQKHGVLYEIYMQEFWATVTVDHHLIRFKMNNKKRIVNLEYFREMLHICPRIPNQTFDELLFEEEILAFLRYVGHSGEINKITDININKLHQPWRSFAVVINKCLSRKSTGYDSLRLSQAQILWGMYHKKNVDFAYFLWKNFVYQVKHKDAKKRNEMYYPRFTKVIINFIMTKDPSIPRRNKIKLATKRSLQQTHISQASRSGADEGTGIIPRVPDVPSDESDKEISWKSSDGDDDDDDQEDEDEQDDDDQDDNDNDQDSNNDDDDFVHPKLSTHDEEAKDAESFDPIVQIPSQVENSDDESNDDESHGINVGGEEGPDVEDDDEELYRDVNINLEGRDVQMTDVHTTQVLKDSHVTLTPVNPDGQQQSSVDALVSTIVVPLLVIAPTLPSPSIPIMSQVQQARAPTPTTALSSFLQDLPNFSSLFGFGHHLKTLEANFSDCKVAVQIQSDRLRDEAQAKNEDFLNKLDENIQKIIKEQVKDKVKTSYAVAADLSELELKKILIEKMKSNKSIHRSDEQKNLYKALVDAYECDKIILDTYGDTVALKRCRDDADKDKEPFVGSDRGSKRRREGKEPESTSTPKEKASKTTSVTDDQPIAEASQHLEWFQKQTKPPTPDRA
nr:hypothetical protein [Tanacetum cinerariifolium]